MMCEHTKCIYDNGYSICTECGQQTQNIETHIIGFNDRLYFFNKPYKRINRLKRLYSCVFGFTKVENYILENINNQIKDIPTRPLLETLPLVKSYLETHHPKIKRKVCSIYRQSGYKFCQNPEYDEIKRMFSLVDDVKINSFNYLLFYIIYFANSAVFHCYRQFLKPQTKRLSKKNDTTFIIFLNEFETLRRFIPIIGYRKIPTQSK